MYNCEFVQNYTKKFKSLSFETIQCPITQAHQGGEWKKYLLPGTCSLPWFY